MGPMHICNIMFLTSAFTWGNDTGSNPVLFFVHGAGECGQTWTALCEEMSSKSPYFMVSYDLRGHGNHNRA